MNFYWESVYESHIDKYKELKWFWILTFKTNTDKFKIRKQSRKVRHDLLNNKLKH